MHVLSEKLGEVDLAWAMQFASCRDTDVTFLKKLDWKIFLTNTHTHTHRLSLIRLKQVGVIYLFVTDTVTCCIQIKVQYEILV